jgi:hypothetical protein
MDEQTFDTNGIGDDANVTAAEIPVAKTEELSPEEQQDVAGGLCRAGGDKLKYVP